MIAQSSSWRPTAPLVRASRRRPCPVCGKPDWCTFSADEHLAVCMRERSDRPARNGGWTHILTTGGTSPPIRPQPARQQSIPVIERARIDHRHAIYTALLGALTLSDAHRGDLLRRGLSPAEIERLQYKSTPAENSTREIARTLSRRFELHGVPGFYKQKGDWRLAWTPPGYMVPYLDGQGRIQALQTRRCPYSGKDKYIWFSSNPELMDEQGSQRYPGGTKSGSPVHYAYGHLLRDAREVTIVEGGVKADVCGFFLQAPVVGIAGVSNFGAGFVSDLGKVAPQLRTVYVAYDRDLIEIEKPEVYDALMRLTAQLERALFRVRIRTWPPPAKGYDDFLLSQLTGQEVTT